MADYIDRDAFIKHYRELLCKDCERRKGTKNGKLKFCYEIGDAPCRACSVDDMFGRLEEFPAADVQCGNKWIPTSERMPKEEETVLCTIEGGLGAAYDICFYTTYFDKFPWLSITSKRMRESDYVKAWMPLPEPYEEE